MRLVRLLSAVWLPQFLECRFVLSAVWLLCSVCGLSVVSCSHTKISISFGSYKSLREFICEDVWMLMGSEWGLSLILLFRVVVVSLACGRDTNQKKKHG